MTTPCLSAILIRDLIIARGNLLVPYFDTENPIGELRTSDSFFDLGLKLK